MADLVNLYCEDGMDLQRPAHLNMCLNKNTSFQDLTQVSLLLINSKNIFIVLLFNSLEMISEYPKLLQNRIK